MPLSDAEVICTFMEAKPRRTPIRQYLRRTKWWQWISGAGWAPAGLNLDGLHEVEARLMEEQWVAYEMRIGGARVMRNGYKYMAVPEDWSVSHFMLHASAEQKITALASVLRPVVEGAKDAADE